MKDQGKKTSNRIAEWLSDSAFGFSACLFIIAILLWIIRVGITSPANIQPISAVLPPSTGTNVIVGAPAQTGLSGGGVSSILVMILDGLASGMFSFAILNLFWHVAIERRREQQGIKFLGGLIDQQPDVVRDLVDNLSEKVRKTVSVECLKSILGDEKGGRLFDAEVTPFFDSAFSVRDKLFCEFEIGSKTDSGQKLKELVNDPAIVTDIDSLLWIDERFGYGSDRSIANPASGNIEVVFVFEVKELHKLLDSPSLYWREVITVNTKIKAAIQKLEAKRVVELLKFEAKVNEEICSWEANWTETKAALRVSIKDVKATENEILSKHNYVVSFRFPQDANVNWAIATSPEPSFSPRWECILKLPGHKLEYAPFFQAKLQSDECLERNDHIRVALEGYVSMRSGAVFMWRPEDPQDVSGSAPSASEAHLKSA